MPTLLILDTASSVCSVTLSTPSHIFMRSKFAPQQHGKWILTMCDEVLKEANFSVADFVQFSAIAFTQGAGASYTGIRMGASVAQAIAFAHQLPLMGLVISQEKRQAASDNLEKYAEFQKNILAPLALEYWQKKMIFPASKLTLSYADDKYQDEI